MGKASIIILYGSSTAGKTTICKELQRLDGTKAPGEQLHWAIEGQDLAWERIYKTATEFCINEINSRKESQPILTEVQKVFPDMEIGSFLVRGKFGFGDLSLPFMVDESIEAFRVKLDEFYEKFPEEEKKKVSKKTIENIRELAIHHGAVMEKYPFPKGADFDKLLFDKAIENSKNGIPTILDLVPTGPGKSVVDAFFEYLDKSGYTCPTHIALVHCPFNTLIDRMNERNRKAKESQNLQDTREGLFPFEQYADIFGAAVEPDARIVGQVKREEVVKAVDQFGKPIVQPSSPSQADALMDSLGFPKEGNVQEIRITAKHYYDRMYNTEAASSTAEVAKKLTALSTTQSVMPSKPHPIAEAFKKEKDSIKLKKVEPVLPDDSSKHKDKKRKK